MMAQQSLHDIAKVTEHFVNAKDRARGLLKFEKAPESYVAVFHLAAFGFLPIVHCFGMKFPIDIVFCDSKKQVRHIYRGVSPGSIIVPWASLLGGCRYLLEFSNCETSQISEGDQLEW